MGTRMSALGVAAYCGVSAKLGAQYGAGRPAAMSTAFHAWCADSPGWHGKLALLSDEEREEVDTWQKPVDMVLDVVGPDDQAIVLDYASSEKELEVALDAWGQPCMADADAATIGHLDFAWVREVVTAATVCEGCVAGEPTDAFDILSADPHGVICPGHRQVFKVAYVADIKKSLWTTSGPDALQVQAYAVAYALLRECDAFVTGLWIPTEGEWLWSKEMVFLDSDEGRRILERVLYAAEHVTDEATTGQHCRDCWARFHCNEHALPAVTLDTWLAPSSADLVDPAKGAAFMLKIQAAEELIDRAKKTMQEKIRRRVLRVVDDSTGKYYGPCSMSGRKSLDTEKLQAALGDQPLADFMKQGKPYDQFRWLLVKP